MTSHYNTDSTVALRCDGDHEWSEPYLGYSNISLVFESGEVCLKLKWKIQRDCTNKHTNDVKTFTSECQEVDTIEKDNVVVPARELEELSII